MDKYEKKFLGIEELERLVRDIRGEKTRTARSYELEAMTIRLKNIKYFSREDVDEIMKIHGNEWRYKIYFLWIWDHIHKVIVLLFVYAGMIYMFGWFITLVSLIPVSGAMFVILFILRLTRGKIG